MNRLLARVGSVGDIFRVWRSGLIDPDAYVRENADTAGGLPASVHWVLFGREEGRSPGTGPVAIWLLSALDRGHLSPAAARQLKRIATHTPEKLAAAATRYGLNANDLAFLRAIDFPDIDKAITLLPDLSDAAQFDAAHRLADRHMRLDGLERACHWGFEQPELGLRDAVKLGDMARALGVYSGAHGEKILDALMRRPVEQIERQVFTARWPVIDTPYATCATLKEMGLQAISEQTEGRAGELARAAGPLAPLLNMATWYGVTGSAGYVCQGKSGQIEPCERPASHTRIIRIRLLMPNYWTDAQRDNRVTGPIFDLYYSTLTDLLAKGWILQPVFATPIFNISHDGDNHIPTLSYHTASPDRSGPVFCHFKESHLPGYFSVDGRGFAGWSTLADRSLETITTEPTDRAADLAFHASLYETYVRTGVSKYDQADNSEPDRPASGYVLATLQIPDDTVNYWAYMPTAQWLDILSNWCAARGKSLIVKRHPHDRSHLTDRLLARLQDEAHVYVSKAPIHELLAKSDWLVTTNSGVGFEALLHLKPVILCGKADYGAAAAQASAPDQLEDKLDQFANGRFPMIADDMRSFLRAYCQDHCAGPDKNLVLEHIENIGLDHLHNTK